MNRLFRVKAIRVSLSTRSTPFRLSRTFASISTMESLKVHNSLSPGQPVPFEPIEKGKITWYACGPTVYDKSHLGHARNYVSTDIIRRILMHYFGADLKFVMNITDVDDKVRFLLLPTAIICWSWSRDTDLTWAHCPDYHQSQETTTTRPRKTKVIHR